MLFHNNPKEVQTCIKAWSRDGFVALKYIFDAAKVLTLEGSFDTVVRKLLIAFNASDLVTQNIDLAAQGGNMEALGLKQYMKDQGLLQTNYKIMSGEDFKKLRPLLLADPEHFITEKIKQEHYPYCIPGRTIGFDSSWVRNEISESSRKLKEFSDSRRSDTAILVGNGPSLKGINFELFEGQDLFISNYAIKNQVLNKYAKGVAVTNYLVAEQEPYHFQMGRHWRFFPLWLGNTFSSSEQNIFLNAVGGKLNFSTNVEKKIFWHSTVSFFWLQILYHAGYRKILMTGFDNSYNQPKTAKEGDLIRQDDNDENHFDSTYFKGKVWQAADTDKMEETYILSRKYFELDGREIVNCTVGGQLKVFRRARLQDELPPRKFFSLFPGAVHKPKVVVVTAFCSCDAKSTENHWRLLNRLGYRNADHIHLYKDSSNTLPRNTLPRVVCADIDSIYPTECKQPHPAGSNLAFVHTVRMLLETGYTHFFWMEPDCVPTSKDWLSPFLERLTQYPDEPIHGTGGGTTNPAKPIWKNHFAGSSLYSLEKLSQVDWRTYLASEVSVSFNIWLSVHLGYIKLLEINNEDEDNTIVYGKNRYNWRSLRQPMALVYGMFEHWRPEKFLSPEQLEERLEWPEFKLYHAIKDHNVLYKIYGNQKPSVSTVIINYNNDKYLHEAISSALNQKIENVDYEVIVVDDGSTDKSVEIIKGFGGTIKPILLNHGVLNSNFNQQRGLRTGIEESQGDIVLLLNSVDTFAPTKVAAVCRMFENIDVVVGQHLLQLADEEGKSLGGVCKFFPRESITPTTYADQGRVNFFQPTSGLAFRRSYLLSQKWLMRPDEHDSTWIDVRITCFAPFFGPIFSSNTELGKCRRHAYSDSIRTETMHKSIKTDELWFISIADFMGIKGITFEWMKASPISFSISKKESQARLFILKLSGQLQKSPNDTISKLECDPLLAMKVQECLEILTKNQILKSYYHRSLSFAKLKATNKNH